jgi:phosphate/phosphite/phosphonate ABC transporter binding protein
VTDTLRFGISRAHAKHNTFHAMRQFCVTLGNVLGANVQAHISFDYDRLLEDVLRDGIELAWMPPLVHARGAKSGIAVAAACERAGVQTYRSAIMVHKDSRYRVPTDLKGARFAWTDRSSASGYVFPRLHLIAAGLDPARDFASEVFLGPGSASIEAVASGTADVCAFHIAEAAAEDRARADADIARHFKAQAASLRLFDVTTSIPPDCVVFGPAMSERDRPRVVEALLAMHESEAGALALHELFTADRLVGVSERVAQIIQNVRGLV